MSATDIHHPQLLDTKAYLADLVKHINKAKHRVNIISLILTDDIQTHALIESLSQAAKRGVSVNVAADVFAYGEFGGYISPFQRLTKESRSMTNTVTRLRTAGVTFTWLGRTVKTNPFGGVTHLKWSVVDDITYCFGGVNLYDFGIKSIDYMFKFTQSELAEIISEQHDAILTSQLSHRPYHGLKETTDFGVIYIDSGKKYESPIYDRLIELAKEASHVLVVTQYCPSGMLATCLKSKSNVYYNQPSKTAFPAKLLIQYGGMRTGLTSSYNGDLYLHSKFMIFTMPDGKKIAMSGSHNFSYSGVIFGTREVAFETTDVHIINQLEAFHKTHVLTA